jgi:hypothetical protein
LDTFVSFGNCHFIVVRKHGGDFCQSSSHNRLRMLALGVEAINVSIRPLDLPLWYATAIVWTLLVFGLSKMAANFLIREFDRATKNNFWFQSFAKHL